MSCDKMPPLWKRVLFWISLTILGAVIGSCVTYTQSRYIYPLWAKSISCITGKKCCYKTSDPFPVEAVTKQMKKLIKENYTISVAHEVEKVKIAPGVYDCQKTYLQVTKHILDRNSGNLGYTIDTQKKTIHVYSAKTINKKFSE